MKILKSCFQVIQRTLRFGKNWLRYSSFIVISQVKYTRKRDQTFEQVLRVSYGQFCQIFRTVCSWHPIDSIQGSYWSSPKSVFEKSKFHFPIQNISSPLLAAKAANRIMSVYGFSRTVVPHLLQQIVDWHHWWPTTSYCLWPPRSPGFSLLIVNYDRRSPVGPCLRDRFSICVERVGVAPSA